MFNNDVEVLHIDSNPGRGLAVNFCKKCCEMQLK